jgi:hypothetical protein
LIEIGYRINLTREEYDLCYAEVTASQSNIDSAELFVTAFIDARAYLWTSDIEMSREINIATRSIKLWADRKSCPIPSVRNKVLSFFKKKLRVWRNENLNLFPEGEPLMAPVLEKRPGVIMQGYKAKEHDNVRRVPALQTPYRRSPRQR